MAACAVVQAGLLRRSLLAATYAAASLLVCASSASAAKLHTLHAFCSKPNCVDGSTPYLSPIADSNGVLYGTAYSDKVNDAGVVYALTPNGQKFTYKVLYRFCRSGTCSDGAHPATTLTIDVDGNLYGTTFDGGANNAGTIFELIPNARRTRWKHVMLYEFCPSNMTPCPDGRNPAVNLTYKGAQTGAPYDGASPLYGTTTDDGTGNAGVLFQIAPGGGKTWKYKVLYAFCSQPKCRDGSRPYGAMIDSGGNLYSATSDGGQYGRGAVVEVVPGNRAEGVLYSFCKDTDCPDGKTPYGTLLMDGNGDFYGTASAGGAANGGVVFKLTQKGALWVETLLHSFCAQSNCSDGATPLAGLVQDSSGNFYGTTAIGGEFTGSNCSLLVSGNDGCGVVYELHGTKYTILHNFCETGPTSCQDGGEPLLGPLLLSAGKLYGTTVLGGKHGGGAVFQVTP